MTARASGLAVVVIALAVALSTGSAAGARQQPSVERRAAQINAEIARASEEGDPRAEFKAITDLALLYYGAGRFDDARSQFERALAFARECQHAPDEGRALINLGTFYLEKDNDRAKALEYYQLGLERVREGGDQKAESAALESLASLYDATDRKKAAALRREAAEAMRQYVLVSDEWRKLKKSDGDRSQYDAFIARFPKSYFAEFARAERHSAFAMLTSEPTYVALLEEARRRMTADPTLTLVVDGHSNEVDEPDFDGRLAQAVVDLLRTKGVDSNRIRTRRFGARCPSPDGRTVRVELHYLAKGESVDRIETPCR